METVTMSGLADAEFLQAVSTVLAGVLIFLTLESKFARKTSDTEYFPGGSEQQKDEIFNKRLARLERQHHRYIVLQTVEGKVLLAMFALMLTSIGLIVLGSEPNRISYLALLARIFFVLSLICLIVRIYLHGKEQK